MSIGLSEPQEAKAVYLYAKDHSKFASTEAAAWLLSKVIRQANQVLQYTLVIHINIHLNPTPGLM